MTDIKQMTDAEINKLMNDHDDGLCPRPYATCIDAAVGWIERRGLIWSRHGAFIPPSVSVEGTSHKESPDCPTARALCIAGLAAWREMQQAKEAAK